MNRPLVSIEDASWSQSALIVDEDTVVSRRPTTPETPGFDAENSEDPPVDGPSAAR
jgi:hypothetical protein